MQVRVSPRCTAFSPGSGVSDLGEQRTPSPGIIGLFGI